jgi:hypothetical protein
VRSSQAFHATQTIPLDEIRRLPTVGAVNGKFAVSSPEELRQIASDELGLVIPKDISADRYLSVVLPYRARLSKLVREIVDESGSNSTAKLIGIVSEINEEIRRLERKKRFLAYRAAAGFAAGNSSIIGALLIAGALAIGGHFAGCGIVAAGAGVRAVSKTRRFKSNKYLRELGREIHASIQPAIAKVLARYLGTTTRAVEVWQLQQELVNRGHGEPVQSHRARWLRGRATALRGRRRK